MYRVVSAEMTEINYSTRFGTNEPGSVTGLATKHLKKAMLQVK